MFRAWQMSVGWKAVLIFPSAGHLCKTTHSSAVSSWHRLHSQVGWIYLSEGSGGGSNCPWFIPMPEKPWRTGLFLHLMNTCACAGPVLSAGRKTWPKPQALESRERLTHIHHPKRGTCCPRVPLLPAASLFSVSQWNVLWEWLWILKPQTLQCSGAEWASLWPLACHLLFPLWSCSTPRRALHAHVQTPLQTSRSSCPML